MFVFIMVDGDGGNGGGVCTQKDYVCSALESKFKFQLHID